MSTTSKQSKIKVLFAGRRKSIFLHVLVVVSYLLITSFYMFPQVTHCSDTVYGFGDNTSGPIWRHSVSPSSPLWGFENTSNFPRGESLNNHVNDTASLQYTWYWVLAKVAGPVCGYNLVNVIGFVATATMMYGFVYWLTRKRSIAFLAGYVVSFAPYFQYKVGGHPSYGYAAILIGAIWLFLSIVKNSKGYWRPSALGLLIAISFYWDPYFSLLMAMTIGSLSVAWLLYRWRTSRYQSKLEKSKSPHFGAEFRKLLIAAGVALLFILPLVFIQLKNASNINNYVSGARGDVMIDARDCSILPFDYIVPSDGNYIANKVLGSHYSELVHALRHKCNPSEYTVGISWAVLTVISLATIIWGWEKLNKRRIFGHNIRNMDYKFLVWCLAFMVIAAALLALPPHLGKLRFPSDILMHITPTWRILARLYLIITVGLTAIFSIALLAFSQSDILRDRRIAKKVLYVLILLAVAVQYQAFKPFAGSAATFSYKNDTPAIIYWLAQQHDIHVIAGYPLDKVGETEAPQYYLTYQTIDHKKLLNSTLPVSNQDALRFSLKDLANPQTLPVLRELGIDALEIHGLTPAQINAIPGLTVLKYQFTINPITGGGIAIARIDPGPKSSYATLLLTGFPINGEIMKSPVDLQYEVQQNATIKVADVWGRTLTSIPQNVCFDIKMADPLDSDSVVVRDGKKVLSGPTAIGADYVHLAFTAPTNHTLTITNTKGHNMRLDMIGCEL